VRVGPIDKQGDAETTRDKLTGAGFEAVIVRVERTRE
jgi:cell division protein FtsN